MKMGKSIFFVINTLQGGGAERVLSTLALDFHKRNVPVNIICLNNAESVYNLPDDLKIIYLVNRKAHTRFYRVYYAAIIFFKLTYLLYSQKPSCVVSFMTTANLWAGLSSMLTNTNFIVSERTTPEHTINKQHPFLKRCSEIIYRHALAVVLPAKGIEDCLRSYKGFEDLKNCRIINNPVGHLGNISGKRVNERKFILGVGRLSYEKGFDQLIEAFANLNIRGIDLLIAGDGQEFAALEQQIRKLKIEKNVKLIGSKGNLQDYYDQAELFVLPSRNEGYPNALIEAMSLGCPCVAMDCEFGPSEIIRHQKNGLLVQDNNIKELTAAIYKILSNPILKNKLATNARQINTTNSLKNISSQWQKIIFSPEISS
jgi:glycosyltransferase involved in cell wall biosynthesis